MLSAFLRFPARVYRDDPLYIAPFYKTVKHLISPGSPFLGHGNFRHFLLYRDRDLCARVTASYFKNQQQEEKRGAIGFFEALEHTEDAVLILEAALSWLKQEGIRQVYGPLNFSTFHMYRFVTKSSSYPPFLMEPYNKPEYPGWFEQAGFKKCHNYLSTITHDLPAQLCLNEKHYRDFLAHGYSFRKINIIKFQQEIKLLYDLTLQIFRYNPLFTPIPFTEFKIIYSGNNFLLDKDLVFFALDPAGREIGFVFGLPDFSENIRCLEGRKNLQGIIGFLRKGLKKKRCICKTFGRLPGSSVVRIGPAMLYEFFKQCIIKEYTVSIQALMHTSNKSTRMFTMAETIREYTLYEIKL